MPSSKVAQLPSPTVVRLTDVITTNYVSTAAMTKLFRQKIHPYWAKIKTKYARTKAEGSVNQTYGVESIWACWIPDSYRTKSGTSINVTFQSAAASES